MLFPTQWRAHAGFVSVPVTVLLAYGCGGSPTGPRQVLSPPVDTTPSKPNDAPVINSLTTASPRVEADQEVVVTATVQDDITPIDQLVYEWSARPVNGTFSGSGLQVRWRAPRLEATPGTYTLTLTVIERFTDKGVAKENRTTAAVSVHYNDSQNEIMRISMRFLTELFPDFSVSPQAAVQDFSDSCSGKSSELSDVTNNRLKFHILSGTYTNVSINVNGAKTDADVSGACTFVDIPMDRTDPNFGRRESVSGICTLTAVYDNWKWLLCSSHFRGTATVPLGNLRYRVPGQITSP
jgi:hypothetical protein